MVTTGNPVYYKAGYKYQVTRDHTIRIAVRPFAEIDIDFIRLTMDGQLTIRKGYAWDGASGPTWDTRNSMRGSLYHDVGYQLIRLRLIDKAHKGYFDQLLYDVCVEDGMFKFRAAYWKWAVVNFGTGFVRPSAERQEEVAP